MFGLRYLRNVVTLRLDVDKCTGCRLCVEVCPHKVFSMEYKRAIIIDRDACMECGACMINCKDGAIFVESGVGCAEAIIKGAIKGTEPSCDCGDSSSSCC
ncbi:MAG: mercury methylation ferredoxin HgcB [Candidatus Zixiibacteriota bacterium]